MKNQNENSFLGNGLKRVLIQKTKGINILGTNENNKDSKGKNAIPIIRKKKTNWQLTTSLETNFNQQSYVKKSMLPRYNRLLSTFMLHSFRIHTRLFLYPNTHQKLAVENSMIKNYLSFFLVLFPLLGLPWQDNDKEEGGY